MPNQPGNKRTDNEKKTDQQGDLMTTDIYSVNTTKLQINIFYLLSGLEECDTHFFLHQQLQQFHKPIATAQSHLKFVLEIFDTQTKNRSHYNHESIIHMICLFPTDFLAASTT